MITFDVGEVGVIGASDSLLYRFLLELLSVFVDLSKSSDTALLWCFKTGLSQDV